MILTEINFVIAKGQLKNQKNKYWKEKLGKKKISIKENAEI